MSRKEPAASSSSTSSTSSRQTASTGLPYEIDRMSGVDLPDVAAGLLKRAARFFGTGRHLPLDALQKQLPDGLSLNQILMSMQALRRDRTYHVTTAACSSRDLLRFTNIAQVAKQTSNTRAHLIFVNRREYSAWLNQPNVTPGQLNAQFDGLARQHADSDVSVLAYGPLELLPGIEAVHANTVSGPLTHSDASSSSCSLSSSSSSPSTSNSSSSSHLLSDSSLTEAATITGLAARALLGEPVERDWFLYRRHEGTIQRIRLATHLQFRQFYHDYLEGSQPARIPDKQREVILQALHCQLNPCHARLLVGRWEIQSHDLQFSNVSETKAAEEKDEIDRYISDVRTQESLRSINVNAERLRLALKHETCVRLLAEHYPNRRLGYGHLSYLAFIRHLLTQEAVDPNQNLPNFNVRASISPYMQAFFYGDSDIAILMSAEAVSNIARPADLNHYAIPVEGRRASVLMIRAGRPDEIQFIASAPGIEDIAWDAKSAENHPLGVSLPLALVLVSAIPAGEFPAADTLIAVGCSPQRALCHLAETLPQPTEGRLLQRYAHAIRYLVRRLEGHHSRQAELALYHLVENFPREERVLAQNYSRIIRYFIESLNLNPNRLLNYYNEAGVLERRQSTFMQALFSRNSRLVRCLLETGRVDLTSVHAYYLSRKPSSGVQPMRIQPMFWVVNQGSHELLQLLLEYGGQPFRPCCEPYSGPLVPMGIAAEKGDHDKMMIMLKSYTQLPSDPSNISTHELLRRLAERERHFVKHWVHQNQPKKLQARPGFEYFVAQARNKKFLNASGLPKAKQHELFAHARMDVYSGENLFLEDKTRRYMATENLAGRTVRYASPEEEKIEQDNGLSYEIISEVTNLLFSRGHLDQLSPEARDIIEQDSLREAQEQYDKQLAAHDKQLFGITQSMLQRGTFAPSTQAKQTPSGALAEFYQLFTQVTGLTPELARLVSFYLIEVGSDSVVLYFTELEKPRVKSAYDCTVS